MKGDIHDIGKNIVKVLLENYGYEVLDLGKDVPPKRIVDLAEERQVKLVGLSAYPAWKKQFGCFTKGRPG